MKNILTMPRWSPYAAGAGIGVLSWATFALMGKALGTSTTAVKATGALEATVAREHVAQNAYFWKYIGDKPVFDWQFALVVMVGVGALVASMLAKPRRREPIPSTWIHRHGPSITKRMAVAFLGGVVMIFGARMAGGCTSGHAISGGLQLAVSSWVFLPTMFISGIAVTMLMFNGPSQTAGEGA